MENEIEEKKWEKRDGRKEVKRHGIEKRNIEEMKRKKRD